MQDVNLLRARQRLVSLVKRPISVGMLPTKFDSYKHSFRKFTARPISCGIMLFEQQVR